MSSYARAQGHPFVYLGYWIEGSRKMRYKNRFEPQERLTSKGWVRTDVRSDGRLRKAEVVGR